MFGRGPRLKTSTMLVFLKLVDYLDKRGLFSDFQYGFRYSRSIANAFNRSGATDISKPFDGVWHAGLVHKLMEF